MVKLITAKTTGSLPVLRSWLTAFIFMTSLLLTTLAQAANITVTASRNPVALDDSFHLIYEADSSVDDDPDFTPIYQHFDVLNSSQSTNMRYINGNYSLKKSWDLALIAKDVGRFTIPAIRFGRDLSPAILITVNNSPSPNSVAADGQASIPAQIFLESSIDKKQGYVQSQFIYTVRLLRTVSIASASLSAPETSDADTIMQLLGEDSYQSTRNGVQYEVFERRYALFPQKSGSLTIKPVTFEGRINSTQPRTIFDQFRISGQLKRLRSPALEVQVKAAPSSVNLQDWLPAVELQLREAWSGDIQQLRAGEPVTRTITLSAEGLTAVQLPDLEFAEVDGLKQYADKPEVLDTAGTAGINGVKQFKVALIPGRAGDYTLPEISLQWWNTETDSKQLARIPQQQITVAGVDRLTADAASLTPVVSPTITTATTAAGGSYDGLPDKPAGPAEAAAQLMTTAIAGQAYWMWLSLFFAIAWLSTLFLLLKKSSSPQPAKHSGSAATSASLKAASRRVKRSAADNEAHNSRTALVEWAQLRYPHRAINNLSDISGLCSAALAEQIRLLNQALYSAEKSSWNGSELLSTFKTELQSDNIKEREPRRVLKPLYRA